MCQPCRKQFLETFPVTAEPVQIKPSHADHAAPAGANLRLAELIPPTLPGANHKSAATKLCTELLPLIPTISATATATKGEPSDLAAVHCLAAFCTACNTAALASVIKRDPGASASTPDLATRLISLVATHSDEALHADIHAILRRIVHEVPTVQRDVIGGLLSNMSGAETPAACAHVTLALHAVMRPPTGGSDVVTVLPPGAPSHLSPLSLPTNHGRS